MMPRITKMRPSKRRPGWIELFLDGVFLCPLPARVARQEGLKEGLILDAPELEALQEQGRRSDATERALHYLAGRPRSRFQLERYLRRKGHEGSAVREAVERCVELGYLDDLEFAAAFARDRIRLRPRSVALLEAELRERGVSRCDARTGVAEALEEEGVDEEELLRRAAEKAWRRLCAQRPDRARRRLLGYLVRRGFRRADIRTALDRLTETESGFILPDTRGRVAKENGERGKRAESGYRTQ